MATTQQVFGVNDHHHGATKEQPHPDDFLEYFPYACSSFGFNVYCEKFVDEIDIIIRGSKKPSGKSNLLNTVMSVHAPQAKSVTDDYDVRITAKYTYGDALTHLVFQRQPNKTIDWKIIRILSQIVHFHPNLTSITISTGINDYCLHELCKLVELANITEICLDDTTVQSRQYCTLLYNAKNIQVLSLCRCKLGDDAMSEIIQQLEAPKPASYTLCALNVSTNGLTDKTATHIAQMLRSNRKLAYLNLNGNRITTEGAMSILKSLTKFQLTNEEVCNYKSGLLKYLSTKQQVMDDYKKKVLNSTLGAPVSKKEPMKKLTEKKDKEQMDKTAAEYVQKELGEYDHPFHAPIEENMNYYCPGNNSLTYLAVAYNHITYPFLSMLIATIQHQKTYFLTCKQKGLANIRIEGNPLPAMCQEYKDIDSVLTNELMIIARGRKSLIKPVKKS